MMVKICGITNVEDAVAAVEGGASALGFNFWPGSPRYVTPEAARRVIEQLPATVWKVGVFVDEDPAAVARIAGEAGLDIVQLHGHETPRDFPPGARIWKAAPLMTCGVSSMSGLPVCIRFIWPFRSPIPSLIRSVPHAIG